ncbi:family 43 glycosylhydrolase [Pedobacter sp. JCM 36344]|uniref:family 43 glycosylhydrolase n=1 Tax=Pedobacter sp. JCM 36344 TaxID=3374280 RepID=UPI00397ABF62
MKLLKLTIFLLFISFFNNSYSQELVLPGDHPDPSVVKIGEDYWAAGTTSNWMPAFPIYHSKDLKKWTQKSAVFKVLPQWADFYMWAPEISYDKGKVYVYYTAHKKDGNLCIGAAVADKPDGIYTDLGPLMCQPAGSIDAFPMRDNNGKLYMIWKEDGNSVQKPTPIWAMEMKEDRTGLIGKKTELFRGDQPWENGLVEGVSIVKNGEYFYAIYAAAGCCGIKCNYGTGIARSKNLLGPWEKYANNPVLASTDNWTCPGHGTPVKKDGKNYFLYHGYSAEESVYAGRQGLLIEFEFTTDGWIKFKQNNKKYTAKRVVKSDDFSGKSLSLYWQWSIFKDIKLNLGKKYLEISALPDVSGAYIGQSVNHSDYTAEAVIIKATAEAGIAIIGDDRQIIFASVNDGKVLLKQVKNGEISILKTISLPSIKATGKFPVKLKLHAQQNHLFTFYYAIGNESFVKINAEPVDGSFLPPWDRALRVGLTVLGTPDHSATFSSFSLK